MRKAAPRATRLAMLAVVCVAAQISVVQIAIAQRALGEEPLSPVASEADLLNESVVDQFIPDESTDDQFSLSRGEDSPIDSSQLFMEERGRGSDERLIDRVNDPTAWLMDVRFRQHWNWPVGQDDPDAQAIQFRPTIPFVAWDHVNLLRVTVPYDLQGASGAGLGDVVILDLVVFDESWGRWGVGPSVRLISDSGNSDSGNGDDTFQAGPAAGAVTKSKHWTVGILVQNFLSDVGSQSRVQPILAYKFNDSCSLGIGESEFRYDWDDATWTQLPLGTQLDYIFEIRGQKLQFFINPQYNFQREASNSGWTLFLGMTLLVPRA